MTRGPLLRLPSSPRRGVRRGKTRHASRLAFSRHLTTAMATSPPDAICPIRTVTHPHSGVTVHHFATKGPLFSALVVVPTTAPADSSGIPHALEHLNFLGSKMYPERGYLDTVATRGLSSGSNAWTADDHTAYSVTNAGLHGLLATLPVLLDHIFFPTLSKTNFVHEIFHMGKDGPSGVLWNEMIGKENTENDLLNQAWRAALFEGTALQNDAGGRTPAIAKLTNESIAAYHDEYYRQRASNVVIVLGGGSNDDTVLSNTLEVIDPILSRLPQIKIINSTPLRLDPLQNRTITKNFPCAEADVGTVSIAWRGPRADQLETLTALTVLLRYLAGTQSSPLLQQFVENSEPIASDIERDIEIFPVSSIVLSFVGVELHAQGDNRSEQDGSMSADSNDDSLEEDDGSVLESEQDELKHDVNLLDPGYIRGILHAYFKQLLHSSDGSGLPGGIKAIHYAIEKDRTRFLEAFEGDPHDHIQTLLVADLLYPSEAVKVGDRINLHLQILEGLLAWPLSHWVELFRTWLLDSPHVDVVMIPSQTCAEEVQKEASAVIESCRRGLGPKGIEQSVREAERATQSIKQSRQAAQKRPLPPVSVKDIPRLPYRYKDLEDPRTPALFGHAIEIDSQFEYGTLCFETCHIESSERELLPLLTDLLLASPLQFDDKSMVPYTEVVEELNNNTVSLGVSVGVGLGTRELLSIDFTCCAGKFQLCSKLICQGIRYSMAEACRVKNIASAALNFVLEDSRDGDTVTQASNVLVNERLRRDPKSEPSSAVLLSVINQRKVLREIANLIETKEGAQSLVSRLDSLKRNIFLGSQGLIQVGGRNPGDLYNTFVSEWSPVIAMHSGVWRPLVLSKPSFKLDEVQVSRCNIGNGVLVSLAGTESNFAEIWVDSEVTEKHPDTLPLSVLCELLSLTEGPIYSRIRGQGLAYDASLGNQRWCGELCFSMFESSDPVAGWNEFCTLLDELEAELNSGQVDGPMLSQIETAKCAVLYGMFESKSSPAGIVGDVFRSCRSGLEYDFESELDRERQLQEVTADDLKKVFGQYLTRFRQQGRQAVAVTCGAEPGLTEKIATSFRNCRYPLNLAVFGSLDDVVHHFAEK